MIRKLVSASLVAATLAGGALATTTSAQAGGYGYGGGCLAVATAVAMATPIRPSYSYTYQPTCYYETRRVNDSYGYYRYVRVRVCR